MSQRLIRILLTPLLLCAGQAMALGLGDIRLSSALNEPLRAEIELLAATPEELDNLTIQMASAETFERYGLDRPLWLSQLQFNLAKTGTASGNIIQVRSAKPITEPFVTFLVEAVWSRGRLLREYTVLLDPPTFAPPPATDTTQAVTPPTRSTQADAGRIERTPAQQPAARPQPAQRQPVVAPAQSQPSESASMDEPAAPEPADVYDPGESRDRYADESEEPRYSGTAGGDVQVRRGDTLWSIANRVRPDNRLTINQVMLAIFEANPEAFAGNINVLSAGSVLRIPSADDVFNISRSQALEEVQRQHAAWSGGTYTPPRSQPSLTLVPPDEDVAEDYSDTSTGSDLGYSREAEIEDRIRELEADVPDQPALLEIRNNELAQLRSELARLRGEEEPEPIPEQEPVAEDELVTEEPAADVDNSDQVFVDEEPEQEQEPVAEDTTEPETEPATTSAPPVVTSPRPQKTLVDTILGYLLSVWGAIGAALIIVLGILVWFARRAASEDDDSETWDGLDAGDESMGSSTERLSALAQDDDTAIVVVEQESKAAMAAQMKSEPARAKAPVHDALEDTDTNKALEDTFSSETAINLDQSDPIAEADFHMAYGLHDQAADLIHGALEVEPEREDLLAKLCEVYFVWGNRDGFVDAAQKMKGVVGNTSSAEWDKIVIMGQQIAADHELFSGKSAGEATKAVDLSFEGGMDDGGALDIDFADDGGSDLDVIDLGAASGEVRAASDASGIDFSFDDDDDGDMSVTREMPKSEATETELEDVFGSADLDDDFGAGAEDTSVSRTAETPTIEQQFDTLATGQMPSLSDNDVTELASLDDDDELPRTDATAEIELDDLGLDLDSLGDTGMDDDDDDDVIDLSDLDSTSERSALDIEDIDVTGANEELDDLSATGRNEQFDDDDGLGATGRNLALDATDASDTTGINEALDIDDALAATSEMPSASSTGRHRDLDALFETESTDDDDDESTSLLDATGQTQVLPEDFSVETGSHRMDEDATMLAPDDDDDATTHLSDDAETLLASLDDDEDEGDFDYARTEALPKDVFTGSGSPTDETGELPSLGAGSTDMDLDLDDLTAALRVSEVGDTINQPRDDATVEQPRYRPSESSDFDDDEDEDASTMALGPDDMSDDLYDARTMTEVGTKLDLARAYVDMGDPAGARGILEEVLDEGDEAQRQQAQQLLDSLPD